MAQQPQRGSLSFTAIVLIVVVGLLAVTVSRWFTTSVHMQSFSQSNASQAGGTAISGLEKGIRDLTRPTMASRVACGSFTGSTTSISGVPGVFSLTGTESYASKPLPIYTPILSAAITAGVTTIPLTVHEDSISNIPVKGRVLIDKEAIDYESFGGCSAMGPLRSCYLYNVKRGQDATIASQHILGALVSQYQCGLVAKGGMPDFSNSISSTHSMGQQVQMHEGWAVGGNNANEGNGFTFVRYNEPGAASPLTWQDASETEANGDILRSVSMLNYATGWAVGNQINIGSKSFTIQTWNPEAGVWDPVAGPSPANKFIQNLMGVSTVSTNEAWAVGVRSGKVTGNKRRLTVLKWDGTNWCLLDPTNSTGCGTVPADSTQAQNFNAVKVLNTTGGAAANIGLAVGNNGKMLRFDGTNWSDFPYNPNNKKLLAVDLIQPASGSSTVNQYWVAGKDRTILLWQGSWSKMTAVCSGSALGSTIQLNAITMLDTNGDGYANEGWVAGNGGWTAHITQLTPPGGGGPTYCYTRTRVPGPNRPKFYGLQALNSNDVWAVGFSGNANTAPLPQTWHWDGSSWTKILTGSLPVKPLYSVSLVAPKQQPVTIPSTSVETQ